MNSEIVVVGSLNMDMVVKASRRPARGETILSDHFFMSPGGKGGNQAYAASRLGASVAMIGRVGNDPFAEHLVRYLQLGGVNTSMIEQAEGQHSGAALITIDGEGDNSIIVAPGANNHMTPDYIRKHKEAIQNAKMLMVQLEIPLDAVMEAVSIASEAGVAVMLDPAPARPLDDTLLQMVDYIVPNESEIAQITGVEVNDARTAKTASVDLLRRGVTTVVAKLGGQGVVAVNANRTITVPGFKVDVVDTTAAGDAFAGALASALVGGKDLWSAIQFANAVGALTVTKQGAQSSMPDLATTDTFIENYSQDKVPNTI